VVILVVVVVVVVVVALVAVVKIFLNSVRPRSFTVVRWKNNRSYAAEFRALKTAGLTCLLS
jgi:hypothetical protein